MQNSLRQLKNIASEFLENLEKFQEKITEIKQNTPTDEESEDFEDFYEIFNESFLNAMILSLRCTATKKTKEELCEEYDQESGKYYCAEHDFVWDRVETGVEQDMTDINYCKYCGKLYR